MIDAMGWEIMKPVCIPILLVVVVNIALVVLPAICFGVDMGKNGYDFAICTAAFFVFSFVNAVLTGKSKRRVEGREVIGSAGATKQQATEAKPQVSLLVKVLPAIICISMLGLVTAILRAFSVWSTPTRFYVR